MTTADVNTQTAGHSAPLRGPLWRSLKMDPAAAVILVLIAALIVWGGAIATFGLPALVLPAVLAAPGVIVVLVMITQGR